MGNILFYCFGLIIPTIFILYSIVYTVFTIGEEYSVKNKTIPTFLLLLVAKLFVICFALFFVYTTIFDYKYEGFKFTPLVISSWSMLIVVDCVIINKCMKAIQNFDDGNSMVSRIFKRILSKNKWLFYAKFVFIILLSLECFLSLFINRFVTVHILLIIFVLYCWINHNTWTTIGKIIRKK